MGFFSQEKRLAIRGVPMALVRVSVVPHVPIMFAALMRARPVSHMGGFVRMQPFQIHHNGSILGHLIVDGCIWVANASCKMTVP